MPIPEKVQRNKAIVFLKENGWTTYAISQAFEIDKSNIKRKLIRFKKKYASKGQKDNK